MCHPRDQKDARRRRVKRTLRAGSVVTAEMLAAKFGVTTRTIYRDIDQLRRDGQPIVGEAGIGYMLRPRRSDHVNG